MKMIPAHVYHQGLKAVTALLREYVDLNLIILFTFLFCFSCVSDCLHTPLTP